MGVPSVAARHIARRRRRPRGGQPYNPVTAFGWKAAFYAGDPLWTPPADGDPVSSWRDGGSEGKNAVQATGTKQPAYRASVAALNNRPAVQGDGVDDFLQTAAWSSALAQPTSLVVVATGPASNAKSLCDGIGVSNRHQISRPASGNWAISAGVQVDSGDAVTTDAHLVVAKFNGASSSLLLDGTEIAAGDAGAHSMTGATLFAAYTGTAGNTAAHVALFGAIAGDITADANWAAFVAWVESEYGLTVA